MAFSYLEQDAEDRVRSAGLRVHFSAADLPLEVSLGEQLLQSVYVLRFLLAVASKGG